MSPVLRDDIAVIDTNIVRILSVWGEEEARKYYRDALAGRSFRISFMTVHEVRFGIEKKGYGPRRRAELMGALERYAVIDPTEAVIAATVELRLLCVREQLSMQDLFIASTAIALGCPLATDDKRLARRLDKAGIQGVISRHLERDAIGHDATG